MGSWFETCAISNLPICDREEIYVLYLLGKFQDDPYEQHQDYVGTTTPTKWWEPLGLPMRAKYDDYGRAVDLQTDILDNAALAWVQEHALEVPAGENPYHDLAVRRAEITSWNVVDELATKDRLFTRFAWKRAVGRCMMRADIVDHLLQCNDKRRNASRRNADQWLDAAHRIMTTPDPEKSPDDPVWGKPGMQEFWKKQRIKNEFFGTFLHEGRDMFMLTALSRDVLVSQISAGDRPTDLAYRIADFDTLNEYMYSLRKHWGPQAGRGSQANDLWCYTALNKGIAQAIKNIKKHWD